MQNSTAPPQPSAAQAPWMTVSNGQQGQAAAPTNQATAPVQPPTVTNGHLQPPAVQPNMSPVYGSAASVYLDRGWRSPLLLPYRKKKSPDDGYTGRLIHKPQSSRGRLRLVACFDIFLSALGIGRLLR